MARRQCTAFCVNCAMPGRLNLACGTVSVGDTLEADGAQSSHADNLPLKSA